MAEKLLKTHGVEEKVRPVGNFEELLVDVEVADKADAEKLLWTHPNHETGFASSLLPRNRAIKTFQGRYRQASNDERF